MPNYKSLATQAHKLIASSDLKDSLMPLWRSVEWQGHAEGDGGAVLCQQSSAVIHLHPDLSSPQQILRAFGHLVLIRAGERGEAVWRNKLCTPTEHQISTASTKLADAELRKTCKTYKDVLDTYPDTGGSVDRLVFINIMNALLANNIAYGDSVGVDILAWGPTAEYCNRKKYHCLVPLVSAYAPADVYSDYGHALAALLADNLAGVRDSSVAVALRGIIHRIAGMVSPE